MLVTQAFSIFTRLPDPISTTRREPHPDHTYPDSTAATYASDAANRLKTVTDWAGGQAGFTYDNKGPPASVGGHSPHIQLPTDAEVSVIADILFDCLVAVESALQSFQTSDIRHDRVVLKRLFL